MPYIRPGICGAVPPLRLTLSAAQNRRGGRVKLLSILLPETEFNHKDKVICRHPFGATSYIRCCVGTTQPRV